MGSCGISFPLAFCCRYSLSHQSFLSPMFNSRPPTLAQYLGVLFPLLFLTVHRILFVHCSTIFFIFRLPCQTWFQSYISYFFSWLLTWSSAIGISFFPENSVASSRLQLMEKGQMEDVSRRISLIFLHIGKKNCSSKNFSLVGKKTQIL